MARKLQKQKEQLTNQTLYGILPSVARETAAVVSDTSVKGGVCYGICVVIYIISYDNNYLHKEITAYPAK